MTRSCLSAVLMATMMLLTHASPARARTWHVNPDGTGDAPTIPAAAESSAYGDSILVDPGTYVCPEHAETGEHQWVSLPSGVSLISVAGAEATVIIDSVTIEWGFSVIEMAYATDCLVRGFTIRRGRGIPGCHYIDGIDMYETVGCTVDSCTIYGYIYGIDIAGKAGYTESPVISNCFIDYCGMGIECGNLYPQGAPIIEDNLINDCGRGIECFSTGAIIRRNRIWGCYYAGIELQGRSPATVIQNVMAGSEECGFFVACDAGYEPNLYSLEIPGCGNSLYNNRGRDIYFHPGDDECYLSANYTYWGSDCPDFDRIIPSGENIQYIPWSDSTHSKIFWECPPQATEPTTWGAIKAMYR